MKTHVPASSLSLALFFIVAGLFVPAAAFAQESPGPNEKDVYERLKAFSLGGGSVTVDGLTLTRDRVQMTFTGTFYWATPVDGRVTGAVFVGEGRFSAAVPPNEFEKENVKRLLGAEAVESDFKTAILRFSDDTFERLGQKPSAGAASEQLQKQANESDARIMKQTGANLPARIALSILNQEKPGFFFATFDGGKRGRFNLILDHQNRLPVANFDINGGEKGLIFSYKSEYSYNEVWMAFYDQEDYQDRTVAYSDVNDLIDITRYDLNLDLRAHKKSVIVLARTDALARFANLRAITFQIGESLSELDSARLKKQLRLKAARMGGKEIPFAQEDWEGGFTIFIPGDNTVGKAMQFEFLLEGDFMYDSQSVQDCHYPRSNETWFPRHGYLDRAEFDLTFRHPKKLRIASVGQRIAEELDPDDKNIMVTKYRMPRPVPLATFALAPFQRHSQMVKWEQGGIGDPIPVEFSSLPGGVMAIKEDFILAELDNSLRYFTALFGRYPYQSFGAAFHPFDFGQGFPSLLMIPPTDRASKYTYVFIAHETAHQWWGDIVSWRSYRDQWLSEGFAEYSGILYTGLRSGAGDQDALINEARASLKATPDTVTGAGKGRLVDVGPIILGHRLESRKTLGAYQTLIYNKGALVLRMLHFLLSDPATGNDAGFRSMMTDFVNRFRDKFASTDDFRVVANEHFAKSLIARKYNLSNLDWFFKQWVYRSELPSYQMEYQIQSEPDGKFMLSGTVTQENAPADWFMPLPVTLSFGGDQKATGTVHALGPKANFQIKLPAKPTKVELDPKRWVLSDKTSTKGN
jgi:hypothetical protein